MQKAVRLLVIVSCLIVGCSVSNSQDALPVADEPLRVETVVEDVGLVVALTFAPDGRLFFAEKSGGVFAVRLVDGETAVIEQILQLNVATGDNESGLLGLALAPDFATSHHFYVYYTEPNAENEPIKSRIVRYTEQNNQAAAETIIVDDLPASPEQQYHFGGGLTIGPDGKLYFIFGDRNMLDVARDVAQLPGSILRYNLDGSIPTDNPFPNSPVYATGIRNGFGLAFNPQTGQLYETENGASCDDELNLILPGADYGWGVHAYDACPYPDDVGQAPVHQWTPVIAPASLMFYNGDLMPEFEGDLLVCGHNKSELLHVRLTGNGRSTRTVNPIEIPNQYELCRVSLTQGPDGWIYATTNNSIQRIGR